MAEAKPKAPATRAESDPKHAQKLAVDLHGGDPLNPNEVLLHRIAAVIDGGKKDEQVTRWAKAFKAVCPDPVQLLPTVPIDVYMKALPEVRVHLASPLLHRVTLSLVAETVDSGKQNDD